LLGTAAELPDELPLPEPQPAAAPASMAAAPNAAADLVNFTAGSPFSGFDLSTSRSYVVVSGRSAAVGRLGWRLSGADPEGLCAEINSKVSY
jgi:hypothetical protein